MTPPTTPLAQTPPPQGTTADLIKDTNTQNFMVDVLEASLETPIIVDFWAPWCGPCKQLTPILEKVVRAANGAVRLVKINIDENQQLAAQMRVQSIPAVYAFFQGRPVDGFMGALPESQLRQFIERLAKRIGGQVAPDAVKQALEQADALLASGENESAAALYQDVLGVEGENAAAFVGLGRALVALKEMDALQDLLTHAPPALKDSSALQPLRDALALTQTAAAAGPLQDLQQKVDARPADQAARLELAIALFAGGQREAAVDVLLESIRKDRAWNDSAARKELVKFFDLMGPMDPLTIDARKRLSSILFA